MGDTFDLMQGGTVTWSGQLADRAATVGDVLTVRADQSIAAAAGGGSVPATREEWSGNGVAIAASDFAWLTWNSSGGPDAALDATIPAHPTVITAGVYLVSVVVRCSGEQSAVYDVGLFLDRTGFDASQQARTFGDAVTSDVGDVPIAFGWYIPAGGEVAVGVTYTPPGGTPANCAITYAHIQRLL